MCRRAWQWYQRNLAAGSPWEIKPPMQPTCDFDRGFVYARHADMIAPQAVRPILGRAAAFAELIVARSGARGPKPDHVLQVWLFLALETAKAIRKKKLPERPVTPTEAAQALALLEGAVAPVGTVKRRLHRLRPVLAEFERSRRAAARARRHIKRTV